MKIASISKINNDQNCSKNSVQQPAKAGLSNTMPRDSVSFGSSGGVVNKLKDGATGLFKWIDKKGFFVEFLIVDTISMIIPRIMVGLNRDKDKTGETNYKAGAEEAGREILSGPSMNLIPMGILFAISKVLPASQIGGKSLEVLTHHMKKSIESVADLAQKDELQKVFADRLFDDAFGNFSFESKEKLQALKDRFSGLLVDSVSADKKSFNAKAGEFEKLIAEINNLKQAKSVDGKSTEMLKPLNTKSIVLNTGKMEHSKPITANVKAGELFEDFHNYSKDIIERLSKTKENAKTFLDGALKNRVSIKMASAVAAFFAVGSFLLYLPRVYQQGKISPAEESAKRAQLERNAAQGGANEG